MPDGTNFLTTASTPCLVPAKYSSRVIAVEDHLRRQCFTLVHVHERLVLGVVRKHDRVDRDDARCGCDGVPQMQAQGLAFAENLGRRPFGRQPPAVGVEFDARREQSADRTFALGDHRRFEQPFWRRDLKVVREIEDVHDQ